MSRRCTGPTTPAVSVVIPAYNAAAFIADAIDSVLAQTWQDCEVIVVDDGSTDTEALERVLGRYRERIRYLRQENRGPGSARNAGILHACSEYVALLDSDDRWLPHYLAEQMKLLRGDFSLDMVYADALITGDSPLAGQTFMENCPSEGNVTFESLISAQCVVITSCVVARRQALIDTGLFTEGFHAEDFDLWLRLAHRGGRIGYQRQVLAEHRARPDSLAANSDHLFLGQIDICMRLPRVMSLSAEQRALVDARVKFCQAHLALKNGKRKLVEKRFSEAKEAIRAAYPALHSPKLRLVLLGLDVAPGLLRRLYLLRERAAHRLPESRDGTA